MKKVLLLLSTTLLLLSAQASEPNEPDSALRAYYKHCIDHLRKPEVVALCDTLFQMARERNDISTQGTAMVFTFDYYYSQNNLDTMKALMARIERFARENNSLKPLYFAWNHLVSYYVSTMHYALAQYELERMLRQAENDGYKAGTAQAYTSLGEIYRLRGVDKTAMEYFRKAIDYTLANDLEKYQLSNNYSQIATILTSQGQYDEALKSIDQAEQYDNDPRMKYMADGHRATIYAKMGNTQKALALLQEVEQNRPPFLHDIMLYEIRMSIFKDSRMYQKALEAADALIEEYKKLGEQEGYYSNLIESRAEILAATGDKAKAYDEMVRFSKLYKEKVSRESENTLGEFATLMGVNELNREKAELEHSRTRFLIGSLLAILLLALSFIFIQMRSKRKLRRAKQAAEEATRMKGEFIRHITHEVNTPLNSIVGFSELAIATPENDPERQAYIDILHENSDYLQKLIDDTLYISDLESTEEAPAKAQTDIAECCRHALNNVAHMQKQGVEIRFCAEQPLPAATTPQYVIKVTTELLRNAIAFTQQGYIELSAGLSADKTQITIAVTDTGCGVPAGQSEYIFDHFAKLNSFSHGLGLGLTVCRMIAHSMGGRVQLDTSYTGGARFVFTFAAA